MEKVPVNRITTAFKKGSLCNSVLVAAATVFAFHFLMLFRSA